jgi:heme-degrading monooxygenase HmoA
MKGTHSNSPATPPIYTTGSWTPFPEHEQGFLDAWLEFAQWSMRMPGAGSALLTRDQRDPARFVSFVAWDNLQAVHAWKTSPDFKRQMARVQQHIGTFAPTELEVVAAVPADVRTLHEATTA